MRQRQHEGWTFSNNGTCKYCQKSIAWHTRGTQSRPFDFIYTELGTIKRTEDGLYHPVVGKPHRCEEVREQTQTDI